MTPARRSALLVAAAATLCYAASAVTQGDPLFLLEAAGSVAVVAWATFALLLVGRSALLARRLAQAGAPHQIAGVACQVVRDGEPRAFVAGAWRPAVFVTTGAIEVLAADELRAVVLHEAHHARTRAPMRAAFVDAWRAAARQVPRVDGLLAARLTAIEIDADRFALAGGVTRQNLAAALVKLEATPGAVGFNGGGNSRLRALLDESAMPAPTAPVEWLPLLVVVALGVGCRLAGTTVGV